MIINKVKNIYSWCALLFFNAFVLFVVLNIAVVLDTRYTRLSRVFHFFHSSEPQDLDPVTKKYGSKLSAAYSAVYPGKSPEVIQALLRETWSRGPALYEAFTGFKERPYRGKYVNVDENGFRFSKSQASWPPDPKALNIFLFGGSTTFGYGVSDEETIPSDLQETLRQNLGKPVSVFNFGRGFYYSTQERILFERLLLGGHIPRVAIFTDGISEFFHAVSELDFIWRFACAFDERPLRTQFVELATRLPLIRVARTVRCSLGNCAAPGANNTADAVSYDDSRVISETIQRYLANKRMIEAVAAAYGVTPIFVWQPTPTYKYDDQKYHVFFGPYDEAHRYSRYGYPAMKAFVDKHPLGENFLWCADIQEGLTEPLYVDQVHYTAKFSRSVASCIAKQMMDRGLVSTR